MDEQESPGKFVKLKWIQQKNNKLNVVVTSGLVGNSPDPCAAWQNLSTFAAENRVNSILQGKCIQSVPTDSVL